MTPEAKISGTFKLPHRTVECQVEAPCVLSQAASAGGVILNVACGGRGVCGGCAVELMSGKFATLSGEEIPLGDGKPHRVLACQTRLLGGPFSVRVPRHSLVEAGEKVVMDFAHAPSVTLRPAVRKEFLKMAGPTLHDQRGDLERIKDALRGRGYDDGLVITSIYLARAAGLAAAANYELTVTVTMDQGQWHVVRLEKGDTTGLLYGAAVDIGTTTVVVALVNLITGKIIDAASLYNQQIIRADDVASRISYASTPEKLIELRDLVVNSTINRLLTLLAARHDIRPEDIAHMTVSGNTVMTHLFCGLSPTGLGGVPFAPISHFPGPYRAGQLHVAINPEAFIDVFPSAAAYVGGDLTADMYVCGLRSRQSLTVLIDVGTNAEIIVGNSDRAIACAAPAGPAFEGRGISCGMRAATGAIETVAIESPTAEPKISVIGKGRPSGVCGSGLIDFVAQSFRAGLLSAAGRFTEQAQRACPRIGRVAVGDASMLAYELVPAELTEDELHPILVSERDVAALLQAKGVIFSALQIAMKHFGKGFAEVDRFVLAGGFAKNINLDNAVTMGLLPDVPRERFQFIGNGSLGGAFLALVDEEVRAQLPALAAAPAVIELNLDADFMDAYTMAMFLPNADPGLFPSVKV